MHEKTAIEECHAYLVFDVTASPHLYTLSLHDALPISWRSSLRHLAVLDARGLVHRRNVDQRDRKSTRLNSSHSQISYAVFCLKKKTVPAHVAVHGGIWWHWRQHGLMVLTHDTRSRPRG